MNTTLTGTGTTSNRKQGGFQFTSLVVGVALAAVAVVTAAPWHASPGPKLQTTRIISTGPTRETATQIFYIVATEWERVAVLSAANAEAQADQPGLAFTTRPIHVFVAGTPEEIALEAEGSREMMSAGVPFVIIDTRDSSQPTYAFQGAAVAVSSSNAVRAGAPESADEYAAREAAQISLSAK